MKRVESKVAMTKIIRDCRNGAADYELPLERAKALYAEGKLQWDVTNGAYCHPRNSSSQQKLT